MAHKSCRRRRAKHGTTTYVGRLKAIPSTQGWTPLAQICRHAVRAPRWPTRCMPPAAPTGMPSAQGWSPPAQYVCHGETKHCWRARWQTQCLYVCHSKSTLFVQLAGQHGEATCMRRIDSWHWGRDYQRSASAAQTFTHTTHLCPMNTQLPAQTHTTLLCPVNIKTVHTVYEMLARAGRGPDQHSSGGVHARAERVLINSSVSGAGGEASSRVHTNTSMRSDHQLTQTLLHAELQTTRCAVWPAAARSGVTSGAQICCCASASLEAAQSCAELRQSCKAHKSQEGSTLRSN
jgi:hypothetical protein